MGTVVVKRGPRRAAPEIPSGELPIEPPPEIPQAAGGRWTQLLLVLPLLTGTLATALMFAGHGEGGRFSYVVGAMFGVSSLSMLALSWGSHSGTPKKAETMRARRDYLRHLAVLRRRVRQTVRRQRQGMWYRHPDPHQLWSTVASHRLWERRPGDSDFAVVRVGTGPQTLATTLQPPVTRTTDDLDPMTADALRRFLDAYSVVPDLPVALSLRGFSRIHLAGGEPAAGLARAIVAQLAVFHAPDDILIVCCVDAERRAAWEWTKWLPHALHPGRHDAIGPRRLVATSAVELEELIGDVLTGRPRPHIVVIVDGADLHDGIDGVTLIDLRSAPPRLVDRDTAVLEVTGTDELLLTTLDERAVVGTADALSTVDVETLARRLAPLRTKAVESQLADSAGPEELLGIGDPYGYDVVHGWAPRGGRDQLSVTIGVGVDGRSVRLDLKESAQDGMGPHGLLIGATGSGKSELLRTIVLGLAATHSPEALNVVLVDFKGGATFASLDRLPHTAALITNLAEELPLVDRMTDALNGELVRRQELLRRTGKASIRDYDRARLTGADLPPLPVLLIVCDEFTELLSAKPDFIELFVQIGRLGRSLGVHLLLASQRLDEGRLRGLETHLSYRIGLRTFSALESRAVLGGPDAYELPRSPGHGYLRYGTEPLVRFRAAYVSGPYRRSTVETVGVRPYRTEMSQSPTPVQEDGSLLGIMVDRLAGHGPPAHQVWLPPLSAAPVMTDLLGPIRRDSERGLSVADPDLHGALTVPVGIVDKPFEQRRDVLWLRLAGSAGHVAVVGGPRSGKSTVVGTLIIALALTHTPAEAQFYCLDFGGGVLAPLTGLPHVSGVAGRQDTAAVRRTVGEVLTLLADRERSAKVRTQVFLVIDGWPTLRGEYEDLEAVVTDVAHRGLSYGVHVIATASRWTDFRPPIRDLFGSRLELRLGDPTDSMVSRQVALNVPERTPGRGITADGLHFLTAVAQADIPTRAAAAWTGPTAPEVRLLPTELPYTMIEEADGLPIGIAESDLRPVGLELTADPHFLLFGDAEAGKSSFLRALATTISRRYRPEQARIVLVDYRRSLLGSVEGDHLIGYGTAAAQTQELIESVAGYLERRLPGPDVTPDQLRDRSWWTGPRCFVLVDDYDIVATGPTNPLLPLLDYLAQARDIGLHLVLTRRCGGAGRAMYEPIVQRLRELSSPGLVMSGDPDEGTLLGAVRPQPLPAGRGWLVSRREGARLIQLAYLPAW